MSRIEAVQTLHNANLQKAVTPTLYITWEAWRQMLRYVRHAARNILPDGKTYPVEINGWAYVQQLDNMHFLLDAPEDVVIIKQTVGPGHADIDAVDNALLFARARQANRASELKLQWHSHVHGGAYFSSTDTNNIENLGQMGASWMLSLVTNVRGEVEARFDQFRPFRVGVPVDVFIGELEDIEAEAGVLEQISDKVTVIPPPKPQPQKKPNAVVQAFKRGNTRDQTPQAAAAAEATEVEGDDIEIDEAELEKLAVFGASRDAADD